MAETAVVFKTSLDVPQLPLPSACLPSLLEDFISPFYYSTAAPVLDTFLNHARPMRHSAVKLSASTLVKKILVLSKGPGFKYDPSEVSILLEVISTCVESPFVTSFFQLPLLIPSVFPTYLSRQVPSLKVHL